MYYVQRDADGHLVRVEAQAYAESSETLAAEHPDIKDWLANKKLASSLQRLRQSDPEMIRVLDDLIQALIDKGVIRVTDLPAPAQAKLMDRSQAREDLGGLSHLVGDDDGLI